VDGHLSDEELEEARLKEMEEGGGPVSFSHTVAEDEDGAR